LTEERFRQRVHQQHTKHAKHKDIYDVLSMFVQSATDILFRLHDQAEKPPTTGFVDSMYGLMMEVDALIVYCNECLAEVSRTYHSVQLVLYLRSQQPTILVSKESLAAQQTRKAQREEKRIAAATATASAVIDLLD
jgi:hypothetical protein